MAEQLIFKSWERPKLFEEDPAHPFVKVNGRLKGQLKITVLDKDTGDVADDEAPFTLMSATDVSGLVIDRAIKHMAPAPGCMDAETTKLVHIDLWDTGLPWRYTPEKNIDDQKPWLILLVGTAEEIQIKGGIVNAADAVFLEHDLKNSHLWAHTQTAADNVKISRILSPRGLLDKKGLLAQHSYVAVLVPGFNDEGNPMWNVNAGTVERKFGKKGVLPAFHYWSFKTTEGGDFETLAAALHIPKAGNVGISQLHYGRDIPVDNVHVKEKIEIGGAITSLKNPPDQQASIDTVRADLDILNDTLPNSIGLPQYGRPWVQNPDDINAGWPGELNDDPRFRGIAGLGLWMGVEAQEDLMDAAVKQAGALREAGQRMGNLALGLMASGSLWDQRLPTDKNQRLRILGPMMGRMLAQGGGLVLDKVTSGTSPLDKALFSSAAQRVLRDRSVQTRNVSEVSGGINYTDALNEANQGEQIPERAPNGLPHLDSITGALGIQSIEELFAIDQKRIAKIMEQIIKAVTRFCDTYRRKRDDMIEEGREADVTQLQKERSIALLEKLNGFLQQLLHDGEMPCLDNHILSDIANPDGEGDSEYIRRVLDRDAFRDRFFDEINKALINCMGMTPCRGWQANNPFSFDNPTLCDDLLNNLIPEHVPDTFPIDLGVLSDALIAALDPRQAEPPAKVRLCSRMSGVDCTLLRPEFPIGLDYPTWVLLKKYDKEWLLPGVNGLEKDSIVALQTNLAFIDAFMVGINTQFMSEMRWRDLSVSRTCTPLRMFWGQVNYVTKKREADINVFNEWAKNTGEALGSAALQNPTMANGNSLVIVFRSDLFRRYPQTLVYLVKPAVGDDVDKLLSAPPKLDHTEAERPGRKYFGPTLVGSITPEITFFSFDVIPQDVDQYWLVLDEPPSELRFVNRNNFLDNDSSAKFAKEMLDKPTRVAISGKSLELAANQ
jgi:hypothetical protein